MAANDGKRLTVFGLGFKEHDNRQMQQILRHYNKLPKEINRTTLYVALTLLAKEVNEQDSQSLANWLTNGAKADEFPFGQAPPPSLAPQASRYHNRNQPNRNEHGGYGDIPHGGHATGLGLRPNNLFGPNGYVPYNPIFGGRGRTIEDGGPQDPVYQPNDDMNPLSAPGTGFLDPPWLEAGAIERSFEEIRLAQTAHHPIPTNATDGHGAMGINDHEMEDEDNEDEDEDELNSTDSEDLEYEDNQDEDMSGMATNSALDDGPAELECLVCYETLPSSDFPNGKITRGCRHKTKVCFACINSSIQEPIARGALHLIICPLCPRKLDRHDIKTYATREVFDRYEYLYRRSQMPDTFIMCLSPNCDAGQVHEGSDSMMVCNFCHFKTCVRHKLPWHEGQTCSEFDLDDAQLERLEDEEASARMLASITSVCPKCKQGVIKSDGCDHMSCVCGNSWCFICMAEWENIIRLGDTAHASWCNNHPNKVAKTKSQREADKNRMTELLHGRPITKEEKAARDGLQARRVEKMRPLLVEAAEKRMQAAKEQEEKLKMQMGSSPEAKQPAKKKTKLIAPWEEGGTKRMPF